jgi:hypothetical protein
MHHNAGIDQTTLRPSVDVEYVLLKDGKEQGKQMEDWSGMANSGQRLTLARLIDTRSSAIRRVRTSGSYPRPGQQPATGTYSKSLTVVK